MARTRTAQKTKTTTRKAKDAVVATPTAEPEAPAVEEAPTGVEGKVVKRKCKRLVEISVKAPGYVPKASRVVDIDKMDAAERAQLIDDLVDEFIEQF